MTWELMLAMTHAELRQLPSTDHLPPVLPQAIEDYVYSINSSRIIGPSAPARADMVTTKGSRKYKNTSEPICSPYRANHDA